jgi:non-ribosomal peptide synthetase component F
VNTTTELTTALAKAHATRGRFQLLDIRIEPGVLSPTLARFVKAVKRVSMPEQTGQSDNAVQIATEAIAIGPAQQTGASI